MHCVVGLGRRARALTSLGRSAEAESEVGVVAKTLPHRVLASGYMRRSRFFRFSTSKKFLQNPEKFERAFDSYYAVRYELRS